MQLQFLLPRSSAAPAPSRVRRAIAAVALAALQACGTTTTPKPAPPAGVELPSTRILELASRTRALPVQWRSEAGIAALHQHVESGGGLLLRGRALGLLPILGWTRRNARRRVVTRGFTGAASPDDRFGLAFTSRGSEVLGIGNAPVVELAEGPVMRVEIDAFERMDLVAGGEVLAEEYARFDGRTRIEARALLCAWRVGRGRVLALGVHGDAGELPAPLRAKLEVWLAGSADAEAVVTRVLDLEPDPALDAWGPVAQPDVADGSAPMMRVPANLLDGGDAPAWLREAAESGVAAIIIDDDGAMPRAMRARAMRVREHGMSFGLAAPQLRHELQEFMRWRDREAPLLDVFVEAATKRRVSALDASFFHAAFRNCVTRVLTLGPLRAPGATAIAYIPADAGRPRGEATPGPALRDLRRFPPACFGVLEIDARPERGAWIDAVHARARAFTAGRPGATVILRVTAPAEWEGRGGAGEAGRPPAGTSSEAQVLEVVEPWQRAETSLRHACELARVLRDPMRHAVSLRAVSSGPSGFEAARASLAERERRSGIVAPGKRSDDLEAMRLLPAPGSLSNRWIRLRASRLEADPKGAARFDEPAYGQRVTDTWAHGQLLGMRISDPRILDQLLTPLDARMPPMLLQGGRTIRGEVEFRRGRYIASLELENARDDALFEFVDPSGRSCFVGVPSGEARSLRIPFSSGLEVAHSFSMRMHRGEALRVRELHVKGAGIEAELPIGRAHSASLAKLARVAHSGHLVAQETSATRGDLPGLVQLLEFRKSKNGLRLRHALRFDGYGIRRIAGGFELRAAGKVPLELRALALGRMSVRIEGDQWILEGFPRAWERVCYALVLPDALPAGLDRARLDAGLLALANEASREVPAAAPGAAASPEKNVTRALAKVAVATGSQSLVEIVDSGRSWVDVRVAPSGAQQARPGLRFRARMPACAVRRVRAKSETNASPDDDTSAWQYAQDDVIWLPRSPGQYRVMWNPKDVLRGPRLLATRASIERCVYDDETRTLDLVLAAPLAGTPRASYAVRVQAPTPSKVEGAAVLRGSEDGSLVLAAPAGRVRLRWARD